MIVRKLRLQRGWSQEHLAQLCGLNVRTIQRIERGQKPSLESKKSLAAVFEVDLASFEHLHADAKEPAVFASSSGEPIMTEQKFESLSPETDAELETNEAIVADIKEDEQAAIQYAKNIKDFLTNALLMVVFIPVILYKVEFNSSVMWVVLAWIAGTILHGLYAFEKITFFNIFKTDWEKKIAEMKLGRKL